MRKLDSFLKESMRLADGSLCTSPSYTRDIVPPFLYHSQISSLCCSLTSRALPVNLFRKAVKDVTLSDGTRIPKGTLVFGNN